MNILIKNCNRNLKKAILELETFLLIKTQKKTINQTKIGSIIKLILKFIILRFLLRWSM